MTPQLMTVSTAAERYAVSRRTIDRWCRIGLFRKIKIGGATRLRIDECDRAIMQGVE